VRLRLYVVAASIASRTLAAQEHQHAPTATEKLGSVHLATSCAPAVTPRFDRAVALLHSFEFGAAMRAFNEVLASDSTCAMAHWGVAMSRWSNPMAPANRPSAQLILGGAAADDARAASAKVSDRERMYIAAVAELYRDFERVGQPARVAAYERAMDALATKYPADTEAKIFHAIALTASAPPTDKSYANQRKAAAILEPIFAKQPRHPGVAHYLIHTYDVPALAPQAVAAARRYAAIAPSAAHALHMPSHTFTRIGQWKASVETNRRSYDVAITDGSIAEALHASDYAIYALLQMRRDSAAKAIVDRLPSLVARFDPNAIGGAAPGSAGVFAIAAIPARFALERRAWAEAAALQPSASAFPWTEAMTYFARAIGATHNGDLRRAASAIDSLAAIRVRLVAKGEPYWAEQVAIQHLVARGWLDLAQQRTDDALAHLREAATRESATEKSATTPGPLAPARESLGDLLLALGRSKEALAEYRATLETEPNRYRALEGAMQAAKASGDRRAEANYRAQLNTLTGK
jgi:tetratricopeptide (TPR) repeat protein